MTIIVDASVVLAALTTQGLVGDWAEQQLIAGEDLAAPEHLHVEVANVLRRAELAGQLDATAAALSFSDLQRMPIRTIPFAPLADRVWALRANLTAYDAACVAAAEALDVPLATLDLKLVNAPGPTCEFIYPDEVQLAAAIADFETEHGEITAEEIAAQRRLDRAGAAVVRGTPKST